MKPTFKAFARVVLVIAVLAGLSACGVPGSESNAPQVVGSYTTLDGTRLNQIATGSGFFTSTSGSSRWAILNVDANGTSQEPEDFVSLSDALFEEFFADWAMQSEHTDARISFTWSSSAGVVTMSTTRTVGYMLQDDGIWARISHSDPEVHSEASIPMEPEREVVTPTGVVFVQPVLNGFHGRFGAEKVLVRMRGDIAPEDSIAIRAVIEELPEIEFPLTRGILNQIVVRVYDEPQQHRFHFRTYQEVHLASD